MNIALSALDEARFGIITAKAEIAAHDDIAAIDAYCRDHQVKLLIARCNVENISLVSSLEDDGYRLMDTLVHMRYDLQKPVPTCNPSDGYLIREMRKGEATAVAAVAQESFADYLVGHYHCDARLPKEQSTAVYVEWAETTAKSNDIEFRILVAEEIESGEIKGFLSNRLLDDALQFFLSGVYKSCRGSGVYKSLFCAALSLAKESGKPYLITSTQINNRASIGMWSRLGFEMTKAEYTFHKWFDREK